MDFNFTGWLYSTDKMIYHKMAKERNDVFPNLIKNKK